MMGAVATARAAVWDIAAQRVTDARAAAAEHEARVCRPVLDAHVPGEPLGADIREVEQASDEYSSYVHLAVRTLVVTPAPTLSAVALKIREAREEMLFENSPNDDVIEALLADLENLEDVPGSAP